MVDTYLDLYLKHYNERWQLEKQDTINHKHDKIFWRKSIKHKGIHLYYQPFYGTTNDIARLLSIELSQRYIGKQTIISLYGDDYKIHNSNIEGFPLIVRYNNYGYEIWYRNIILYSDNPKYKRKWAKTC